MSGALPVNLRALVRTAAELAIPDDGAGADRTLPVLNWLRPLLPGRGLRRGATTAVMAGQPHAHGGTSLMLALIAEASRAGAWSAVVGVPDLGLVCADEYGIALNRLVLVPSPGPQWPEVVAALLDGFDVVVLSGVQANARERTQLAARARDRSACLIPFGAHLWEGADLTLTPLSARWQGLDQGYGHIRELTIGVRGRGASIRPRQATVWFPDDQPYRQQHSIAGELEHDRPPLQLVA